MSQSDAVTRQRYSCAECGCVFYSDWSHEEAVAEAVAAGFDPDAQDMAVVCDDCYAELMSWGRDQLSALLNLFGLLHGWLT
jgi:hypothetical protein